MADDTEGSLVVVEDDDAIRRVLVAGLRRTGHSVVDFDSAEAAIPWLSDNASAVVVSDIRMGGAGGLDVLHHCRSLPAGPEVILVTAHSSVADGVAAIKQGALDYMTKPINLETLLNKVNLALERRQLTQRVAALEARLQDGPTTSIIGESAAVQTVRNQIQQFSPTELSVVIVGETGTGKELVARALHAGGPRSGGPFIAVNCAALPETIVERELFGHEKGSFTGAGAARPGFFEAADGGTLFLDEITELSAAIQAKLLRVIEYGEFFRLGSTKPQSTSVRILAATNEELLEASGFRQDLYYRIATLRIDVPPLRSRGDDIALLLRHFLRLCSERQGKKVDAIAADAESALHAYSWPGNVRELHSAMQFAVAMASESSLRLCDLPASICDRVLPSAPTLAANTELPYGEAKEDCLQQFNRHYISGHLAKTGGSVTNAAESMQLPRTSLQRLMKKYQIDRQSAGQNS